MKLSQVAVLAAVAVGGYVVIRSLLGSNVGPDWFRGLLTGDRSTTDPSQIALDRATPIVGAATLINPVQASPSLLAYSYKQAAIDLPALLRSDDLFTPSAGGGSAGSYLESGTPGTAAGPSSDLYQAYA